MHTAVLEFGVYESTVTDTSKRCILNIGLAVPSKAPDRLTNSPTPCYRNLRAGIYNLGYLLKTGFVY